MFRYKLIRILLLILVPAILFAFSPEASAGKNTRKTYVTAKAKKCTKKKKRYRRKRRHYNPNLTRAQAIDIIRCNSEKVCMLAGLEPVADEPTNLIKVNEVIEDDSDIIDNGEEAPDEGEYGEDPEELELEDDVAVDMESFRMLWLSYVDNGEEDEFTAGGINKQKIMETIMEWLGTPYRFGSRTKGATDCSGFVQNIFRESSGVMLPRTARTQINVGARIAREDLEFGDMIFFHTYSRRYASHVGIYLGDDLFAHASSRYGVTVSSLESTYYNKRFIGGRRLTTSDITQLTTHDDSGETQQ